MKTVLVVDDNQEIGEMVTERLELAGYRGLLADGGCDQQVYKDRPDIVLCDMRLSPDATAGVATAMRAQPGMQSTPVVLMSSYYGYVAAEESSLLAFKPFGLGTLLEIVEANIGQP